MLGIPAATSKPPCHIPRNADVRIYNLGPASPGTREPEPGQAGPVRKESRMPEEPRSFTEADIDSMPVLVRRRIEAMVLGPMIRAFQDEFGEQEANRVAQRVIEEIAKDQGAAFAKNAGGDGIAAYVAGKGAWTANNALEIDVLEMDEKRYDYNVTRCRYAEMYRDLGMQDLGFIFSCGRDFNFPAGYNKNLKLSRTQTIMQGAAFCNFRYEMQDETAAG